MPARSTSPQLQTESIVDNQLPPQVSLGQRAWRFVVSAWAWAAYGIGSLVLVVIALIVIFGLGGSSIDAGSTAKEVQISGSGLDKIVVIHLDGVVGAVTEGLPGNTAAGITASQVHQDLQQAAEDPLVKAVILRINSPGGSAVESDAIFHRVQEFQQDTKKIVIASFGDVAASGGYYIALPANKIVANTASLTGSIGVILEYYDATGLLQKIGVSAEVIKSGQFKDIGSMNRPTTPAERAVLQSVVDDSFNQFVDRVVEGRHMDEAKVRTLADGRIYSGHQALDAGLVDALGNIDTAIDLAKSDAHLDSVTVVEYHHGGLFESLLGVMGQSNPLTALNRVVPATTTSLMYKWQP